MELRQHTQGGKKIVRTTPLKCWDSALIGEGVAGATEDKTAEVPQAQAEDTAGANKPARNLLSEGHGSFLGSPLPQKREGTTAPTVLL